MFRFGSSGLSSATFVFRYGNVPKGGFMGSVCVCLFWVSMLLKLTTLPSSSLAPDSRPGSLVPSARPTGRVSLQLLYNSI